ncbi:hypothetical protein QTP88_000406 [Uroleucon formosanum]
MSFKLNEEKKNNISNHGEHSTWFNTKSGKQGNNEYSFMKEGSLNLTSPIMRLDKCARKLPETTEEHTFGLNQRCPKRRKIEHYHEKLIKNNFIAPFNAENQTVMSVEKFCEFKYKPLCYKTSLLSPSLTPKIILNLMKNPSVNKLMKALEIMYTESMHIHGELNDMRDYEKIKQLTKQLKRYLFELCYQQFCKLWLHKTSRSAMPYGQKLNRFTASLLKYTRNITTVCNKNLKKLLLNKSGLMGYPKISHLIICLNILRYFFTNLMRKISRMYLMRHKKKQNFNSLNKKHSIKLYVKGTTKKKSFLDIVNEYRDLMNTDKLSFYEVADIKYAYEDILKPGQHITKKELDICANENYNFKINYNISSNEKNDDFVFDDIESIQDWVPDFLDNQLNPEIENCNKTLKCPYTLLEYVYGVQSSNNVDLKNESIEKIETESHIQSTSNEDRNIDVDISTDDLDRTIATNYSGAETSFENLKLKRVTNTLIKKRNSSNNYSKISERFNYKLLSHQITLTKSEERMLSTIILADMNPYYVKWKRQKPSERTKLFQIILYFGSLKMGLCDKLHLARLDLKGQNICDMIDIEKLLKSIKIETCILQECFTFTEGDNFLTWPLGKLIINNNISQRSQTINILFSFVKNIITKFCKKAKEICRKSGLRIVLNKESSFESLSNVRIGEDVLNTELSLKYANVHNYPSPVNNDEFLNDVPGTSNSEHFYVTNTGFCVKKNSLNKEICKSMVNILKSDDSIHQSWKECNNSQMFISNLLRAGITLPIRESNTGHGSKFAEVYVRWFCEEYLQDDTFYKLALSFFKNIFLYIDPASGCTDIKVVDAINNAFMILYDQPCFAKAYESYLNTKYPKCMSSSKHVGTNDPENHSDYKGFNIRAIEELQIELNVNVQTDPIEPNVDVQTDPIEPNVDVQTDLIDTNNVDMSLVPSNIPTSNEFDILNDVIIKNLITPDLQSASYDIDLDFLHTLDEYLYGVQSSNNVDPKNDKENEYIEKTDTIEPNVDVQTDPIDTNYVDISLLPSNIPTSNEFDILNDITIKNLITPDLQSANYDMDNDFLLQNCINENSDNLMENIDVIDDGNNIFDNPDTAMINIDDPNYNNVPGFNEFNEDSPFDDAIPTTVMSYHINSSNGMLGSNSEFQQTKNTEDIDLVPISSFDPFINFGVKGEKTNLQLQQAKNMEDVSMISSDQFVNFDQNDEINLNELGELDNDLCGFYNAGVLLPP